MLGHCLAPLYYLIFKVEKFIMLEVEELAETNTEDNWWLLLEKHTKAQSDTYSVQRCMHLGLSACGSLLI